MLQPLRDMKQPNQKSKPGGAPKPGARSTGVNPLVLAALGILLVAGLIWVVNRARQSAGTSGSPAGSTNTPATAAQPLGNPQTISNAPSTLVPPTVTAASTPPEPVKDIPGLVASITEIDLSKGSVAPAVAAQWRQGLQRLVLQGAAAVPPIREFLNRNVDLDLGNVQGAELLGYATLRLAFFDVLRQIRDPESVATMVQVLKATADPREIGTLARNLEEQAPGQHVQTALAAAREALTQAAAGLLEGHDVGPLFEVLQKYGGKAVAPDMEQVGSRWNFYSTMALGGLPDGAGIPALSRMAQDQSIQNVMALRVLAQLAGTYPEARAALVSQVRSNTLPFTAWSGIRAALGGEIVEFGAPVLSSAAPPPGGQDARSYHINYGNQNYRTVSIGSAWTDDRVKQQVALIDELIAADSNLETLKFLQEARLALAARVSK